MSLFEDNTYIYRDTFFVYLSDEQCPTTSQVADCFAQLGSKYEVTGMKERDGKFGAVTVKSPQDSSAMDITYVSGEEVQEQISELMLEFRTMTLTGDDREKLGVFQACNARFDVYHFEQQSNGGGGPDEVLDPGGLLLVLERLATLVSGVALDPQSQTIL